MPKPSDYENESDFVSACVAQRQDEHPDEETEQSAAACYSMWRDKAAKVIVHKTHTSEETNGMEFVLSDATIDRYGDVIEASGWELENFRKNPIALFNHNPDFPVGRWEGLSVKGAALRGHLRLAPEGTSPRIDEIRKLIEAGILRAVSVGFRPIESKPRSGGELYTKSELVETSLVAIPANPNALAISKSLKISDSTLAMVFAKHGEKPEANMVTWKGKRYPSGGVVQTTWGDHKIWKF